LTSTASAGVGGVRFHRVIFIDVARAMAVVLMVFGHTSSALLSDAYRVGDWLDVWTFQRGLTSGFFLLVAGLAFSVATSHHWPAHTHLSVTLLTRLRRFAILVVLGYALHFPVSHLADLATATDQQWRRLFAVDVLQMIGVTFMAVQALVMVTRSRRMFTVAVLVVAAVIVVATPTVRDVDWVPLLPLSLVAYLSTETGSQFPLFPWSAYVLCGAALGQLYARWGAAHPTDFANWGMLAPGLALIVLASYLEGLLGPLVAGASGWIPRDVALRAGSCLLVLGMLAHATRNIARLPRVFSAVAQESLLVYFVHLCVVYGSVWNVGLYRFYGETLSPAASVLTAVAVVVPMIALAWLWNGLKHSRPVVAKRVTVMAGIGLTAFLL
jgi:uncharacterized membrane protein